ncbi:MAG: hypothetical protein M1821_003165 [Bathelium mastoideum]|nr:MAG: hypothetical protein M1821_003165 [Bathelium mastoideum]
MTLTDDLWREVEKLAFIQDKEIEVFRAAMVIFMRTRIPISTGKSVDHEREQLHRFLTVPYMARLFRETNLEKEGVTKDYHHLLNLLEIMMDSWVEDDKFGAEEMYNAYKTLLLSKHHSLAFELGTELKKQPILREMARHADVEVNEFCRKLPEPILKLRPTNDTPKDIEALAWMQLSEPKGPALSALKVDESGDESSGGSSKKEESESDKTGVPLGKGKQRAIG